MKKQNFRNLKIFICILVMLMAVVRGWDSLNAEGLQQCYPEQCTDVYYACYGEEYQYAYYYWAGCDYGYCVSLWRVTCRDADCEDCDEGERLYIRTAMCEKFDTRCL